MLPMAVAQSSTGGVTKSQAQFWDFLHWQCIVHIDSIWDPYKNGWTDWDALWDDEWAWPKKQSYMGWRSPMRKEQFGGKHVSSKPITLFLSLPAENLSVSKISKAHENYMNSHCTSAESDIFYTSVMTVTQTWQILNKWLANSLVWSLF